MRRLMLNLTIEDDMKPLFISYAPNLCDVSKYDGVPGANISDFLSKYIVYIQYSISSIPTLTSIGAAFYEDEDVPMYNAYYPAGEYVNGSTLTVDGKSYQRNKFSFNYVCCYHTDSGTFTHIDVYFLTDGRIIHINTDSDTATTLYTP